METLQAIRMVDITKTFGKVVANDRVHLDIYPGEILSLLGKTAAASADEHALRHLSTR